MMTKKLSLGIILLAFGGSSAVFAAGRTNEVYGQDEKNKTDESIVYLNFGNFDTWLTRNIKESGVLGGKTKTLYEIAPNGTWNNNNPYTNQGGSPWATSNVLAKVSGITKTNVSVYKEARAGHGYCAKLYTHLEECKVLGLVNIKFHLFGTDIGAYYRYKESDEQAQCRIEIRKTSQGAYVRLSCETLRKSQSCSSDRFQQGTNCKRQGYAGCYSLLAETLGGQQWQYSR